MKASTTFINEKPGLTGNGYSGQIPCLVEAHGSSQVSIFLIV